jgi:hypothetical protein
MSIAYEGEQGDGIFTGLFAERSDTLFVVAAGNSIKPQSLTDVRIYPASLGHRENVITVAAHDARDPTNLSWFSNYHPKAANIAAPGCGVMSWIDEKNMSPISGTSQAAPLVTFTAALLESLDASLKPVQKKARILASGDLMDGEFRWNVSSGSKLNIAHAILLFDDLVRVKVTDPVAPDKQRSEVWIGDVAAPWGLRCSSTAVEFGQGYAREALWAYKRQGADAILIPDRHSLSVPDTWCAANLNAPRPTDPKPHIKFTRRARIEGSTIVPDAQAERTLELDVLDAIILRGPHFGRD